MSVSRKRLSFQEDSQTAPTESSSSSGAKKRMVQRTTVEKWMKELDKEHSTSLWLKFEVADRDHVSLLKCSICSQFSEKLQSMRNFRSAFIDGSSNVRVSNVKEHAGTDMHSSAMHLLKKQHSSSVFEYAPIARCLGDTLMDETTRKAIEKKFDIAYMIAKEKMAFTKMKSVCDLEERHGV